MLVWDSARGTHRLWSACSHLWVVELFFGVFRSRPRVHVLVSTYSLVLDWARRSRECRSREDVSREVIDEVCRLSFTIFEGAMSVISSGSSCSTLSPSVGRSSTGHALLDARELVRATMFFLGTTV